MSPCTIIVRISNSNHEHYIILLLIFVTSKTFKYQCCYMKDFTTMFLFVFVLCVYVLSYAIRPVCYRDINYIINNTGAPLILLYIKWELFIFFILLILISMAGLVQKCTNFLYHLQLISYTRTIYKSYLASN